MSTPSPLNCRLSSSPNVRGTTAVSTQQEVSSVVCFVHSLDKTQFWLQRGLEPTGAPPVVLPPMHGAGHTAAGAGGLSTEAWSRAHGLLTHLLGGRPPARRNSRNHQATVLPGSKRAMLLLRNYLFALFGIKAPTAIPFPSPPQHHPSWLLRTSEFSQQSCRKAHVEMYFT